MVGVPMELPVDYHENGDGTVSAVYANQGSRVRVFFKKTRKADVQKMLTTGEECFVDEILLVKKVKGSTNTPVSRATAADKRKYRKEWERFQRGDRGEHGDTLSDLYGIRPIDVRTLHAEGIYTIQELIDADERQLDGIEGIDDLQELARIWAKTRGREKEEKLAITLVETYKTRNETLEQENLRLKEELEAQNKPKRRGRPRKKDLEGENS